MKKINLPIWQGLLFSHQYLTSSLKKMPKKKEKYTLNNFLDKVILPILIIIDGSPHLNVNVKVSEKKVFKVFK